MNKYEPKPYTFVDFLRDYNHARYFGIFSCQAMPAGVIRSMKSCWV